MRHPTPLDNVKHQIFQILSRSHKQLKNNINEDQWKDFETFFWKIRPLVNINYSEFTSNHAETSGPNKPKFEDELKKITIEENSKSINT